MDGVIDWHHHPHTEALAYFLCDDSGSMTAFLLCDGDAWWLTLCDCPTLPTQLNATPDPDPDYVFEAIEEAETTILNIEAAVRQAQQEATGGGIDGLV